MGFVSLWLQASGPSAALGASDADRLLAAGAEDAAEANSDGHANGVNLRSDPNEEAEAVGIGDDPGA